ncbi:MAG: (2Fe-2S) ferredoxin domain-containing protein [Candidatus Izemoplasmatales bacterium]|jgi:NADP-reducing hydrogenase subunit HndB|nr:(2Fe-2S) ferredoxin domain-containing protein [Candidatus Izemoplasmatales bacterium]MDD3865543.1 (2Fe-2S) ferredoxin domain-containing protein [Candidatus Izemoplasmatales bacterium]
MKSLDDLQKLRDKAKRTMDMTDLVDGVRIQVGMGTCGIAAGARPVLQKFIDEVAAHNLHNIIITQVGCMGECAFEPIVEIVEKDGTKTTYCKVGKRLAEEIVEEHLINGNRLDAYMLSTIKR